jgi:AraC family transcriptional regulator
MVSFLPTGCERRLRLHGVEWSWASITLEGLENVPAFGAVHDPVIRGALAELARVHEEDGHLEPSYCEAFAVMLSAYVSRRFSLAERAVPAKRVGLTDRQLRRLREYVEAHLDEPIRVASLARLLFLSEGHLHRALRMSTGDTPLTFINRHRIERAAELFRVSPVGIQEAALTVGFTSPSAFARVFQGIIGCSPSEYRRAVQR